MAREFNRADRVADALQRILANLIQFEVRDPRVGMVNINDVSVSRDLAYAKVYVTFVDHDNDQDREAATEALNKAAGFLRGLISKEMTMRITPRLQFVYDKTSVKGQALSHLIDRALAADRAQSRDDDSE